MKYKAIQNPAELEWFCEILKQEDVRSYLEIGSKFGGSLSRIAHALPVGSCIVSVDLPWGDKQSQPYLERCVAELQKEGYETHLFLGDSTRADIISFIGAMRPFDACLIDANHTLPFVTADWNSYGQMSRIVAFHDIAWIPRAGKSYKYPIEVPHLWSILKTQYRHKEIKLDPQDNGIGVIWRY